MYSPSENRKDPKPHYHGKTIFFSRHGESECNIEDKIGGDPPLSDKGFKFAKELGRYVNGLEIKNLKVWTSLRQRTISTAESIKAIERKQFLSLNEIDSGSFDGFTYDDVAKLYPEEFEKRQLDKLSYRYPGGESYVDCCNRIIPFLEELELERRNGESTSGILVVAHQAILRCIFGYLLKSKLEDVPHIKIPQHTLMQVTCMPKCKMTNIHKQKITGATQQETLNFVQEICSIDYFPMSIDHAEQGVIHLHK